MDAGAPVVIVDTNNPAELPDGINDADIQAIIDHHKLVGGLETKGPIDITIRPLACTATIMYDLMGDDAAKMPEAIKGAALSCILSDTLEFRSPTTTDHDRAVAQKLADDLGIDMAPMPPTCSRRNQMYRRSAMRNCCAWIPRNMKWAENSSVCRFGNHSAENRSGPQR